MIVIDRIVQHDPVIPKRQTPHAPLEPTRILRFGLVLMQKLEQRLAFGFCPAAEALGVGDVEVEDFLASFGMGADCWVAGGERFSLLAIADAVFTGFGDVGFGGCVDTV